MERVAEWTLAFADRTLFFILSDSSKNDLLAFIGKLLGGHRLPLEFLLFGRKSTFNLRQPVSVS